MADDGIRAITPLTLTLTTSFANIFVVPAGKEWTIRMLRATTSTSSNPADAFISIFINVSVCLAFNAPIKPGQVVNFLGPDFITLPPGDRLQARASVDNNYRIMAAITERDL